METRSKKADSPPVRATRYHHGDLRKALLAAAEAELAEKGVEGFTLRGVAKRAGVSHAAPAHHFKDTRALLTALAAEGFARLGALSAERVGNAGTDPKDRLIASGLGYIEFASANPALFKLMFGSDRPVAADEALHEKASGAFTILIEAVGDLTGAPPFDSEAGIRHVAAAWAIVHGLAHLLIADKMSFLEPMLERDREAVLAGILERITPDMRNG
ncbi:MAG: TetR/AcrR family transcriptional regulator [Rhizobiaceae bacterium]|nr:TetR/AcrR family transcriptional regulator [Rhizobiaceae bacterium]MCV0406939.1 TetR/AcrR family transcriptional regulator [Rhizobiaceae bacterium]